MSDDYGTHHVVMADLVSRTDMSATKYCGSFPVLECGMGYGSTPMLHRMCANRRLLVSLDTVKDWADRFRSLASIDHVISVVNDWKDYPIEKEQWAVAFIDNAPGETRIDLIRRLKGRAHWIVAHDSERDYGTGANYGYEKVKPLFKYVSEYRFLRPYTLVLSDYAPYDLDPAEQVWTPDAAQQKYFDEKGLRP